MDFNVYSNTEPNKNVNNNIDLRKYKGMFMFFGSLLVILIVLAVSYKSFTFTVSEREQVVVRQFGEIVRVVVDENSDEMISAINQNPNLEDVKVEEGKGLFFKIPFIQSTESYDSRLLTYDTNPRDITTKDKKKISIDNFALWKIKNPALFIATIGTKTKAYQRLDELVYSKLNEEMGKVDAHVVISDKDYVFEMTQRIVDETNSVVKGYGIEVVDVRIKKTDLPIANHENVFNRMRTERIQAAKKYRSEGNEEAQKIRSEADKEATILEAQAYEKAEEIKGEGDAEALRIYAEAYNQDPEFYSFWRTLQAYRKTLDGKTKIVIDPDSEFAKYLFGIE